MYILDTNIFLRALIREDEKMLSDCVRLLDGLERKKFKAKLPGIVLAEIVWMLQLHYRFPKDTITSFMRHLLSMSHLFVTNDYQHFLALGLFTKHNIKYVDCCIASLPGVLEGKHTIVSYDKEFDRLGVKRVEPGTIVAKL